MLGRESLDRGCIKVTDYNFTAGSSEVGGHRAAHVSDTDISVTCAHEPFLLFVTAVIFRKHFLRDLEPTNRAGCTGVNADM